ncbi:MAG: hypothetical protein ACI81R_002773 [Bradymonadia bacterium]|jgi:hypothetical protein
MIETITFPVRFCVSCVRDVVTARDLDDADAWIDVCTRCGATVVEKRAARRLPPSALSGLGYSVEGEGSVIGCGDGGCDSCGASACST